MPAIFASVLLCSGAFAAPPGAIISNSATLEYRDSHGQPAQVTSNVVQLTAAVGRTPASIEFSRVVQGKPGAWRQPVGPSACLDGGTFADLGHPRLLGGAVIDPALVYDLDATAAYNIGEPAFIRLADADQNLDYRVIEYVEVIVSNPVAGDSETIRLAETGPDTGVFSGFVPTGGGNAVAGDCRLQASPRSTLLASYTDPADGSAPARSSAVFDPVQRVFETRSGSPVSGVTIEIVDAATGLPATVYGNDGTSLFPSSIVSGGTATDSSGTAYHFGAGEYRFPVVPDGDYRLNVTPPSDYAAPSVIDAGELQALPGAPFLLGGGSYGEAFSKAGDISIALDIPVDPRAQTLFLQKRTLTASAAPGDFVHYEIVLENVSVSGIATGISVVDQLPEGLRFVPGSVTIDGDSAADPQIGTNRLEFDPGFLDVGESRTIAYVVEVVGGKLGQELVNRAFAFASGGLVSNEASAAIRLTEDLFRSSATIIGRVLEGDCGVPAFAEDQGVAGVRVYLEDGRYAVTDAGGRFHFEGLKPGTHVAQLDTFTIPEYLDLAGCPDAPAFSGRADSQFVKLARGSLVRADFYLGRKPAPQGRIDIELESSGAESADLIAYDMTISGTGNVPVENIDVVVLLPAGIRYRPGSMKIDGRFMGNPRVSEQVLSLALPDRRESWTSAVAFVASIDADVSGDLTTKAYARFDSPVEAGQKTPVAETRMVRDPGVFEDASYVLDLKFGTLSAELSASDTAALDRLVDDWLGVGDIRISAVGHTDSQPIAVHNRGFFADNHALSKARADSAAGYLAAALGVQAENIRATGRGADEPIADNATVAGRAGNRRVELEIGGVRTSRPSFLNVTRPSSGTKAVGMRGAVPGLEPALRAAAGDESPGTQEEPPIDSLVPGIGMLLPKPGYAPAIPAIKVSIQHEPAQKAAIWVNGIPVNPVNFDTTAYDEDRAVAVSRWRGVDLADGSNQVRAIVSNADGSVARSIDREVYYAGAPSRAEIDLEQSVLIADGKTKPVVAVRLFDAAGRPSRRGMVGGYRVAAPYRSWWDVDNDRQNSLVQISSGEPTYRIGADGVALIELEPTTQTGELTLQLKFENYREQELRTWIGAAPREWILVGFAEGTAGYRTLAENGTGAGRVEDGYYDEGRVAFFAKGQIKGEYLLTLAYDSDRDRSAARNSFETVVDPDRYYPLYADTAEQRFEAPSQRRLYLKLERGQFFALFGDFETGLGITELSRYQRRFNGLHSEYRGEHVGFTAFAADSDQAFKREELRGDGTSGLYRLLNAPVIANSERIRIEVRDRFDSARVVSTTNLIRFLDYDLDTLRGTLYFKRPVPNRDLDFNPVFIVAEYETTAGGQQDLVAGARASLRSSDDDIEIGLTRVSDRSRGAEATLTGLDARWQLGAQTLLKAEIASSDTTSAGAGSVASAHAVELEHNSGNVNLRAFVREVEDDFGMGYQSAADKGVRRLGVEARLRLGESWYAEGEAAWQQMLASRDIRNLVRTQLRYDRGASTAMLGVTHAEDEFGDGDSRSSDYAEFGLTQRILDGQAALRASVGTALGGEIENVDFPTKFVFGADYRVADGVDLVAEYEESQGRDVDASMARLGVRATPWARAQLDSSLVNEVTEFGPRLFANVGLVQGFQLNERWLLDVGLDQSNTVSQRGIRRFDVDRELTSGSLSEDFLAVHAGAMYSADAWSANTRVEFRESGSEKRATLLFGWYRQPASGHGLSAGLTVFRESPDRGNGQAAADLRLGWAYRPAGSRWSFLDRLDLAFDEIGGVDARERSWRIVNNFSANKRVNATAQISLQYAFKYVRSIFDSADYSGYTDLIGLDYRRGMRQRWDAGFNTSIYRSYRSGVVDYGWGIDIGYKLATNVWISLGYNLGGFYDSDFSAARYTAKGPFLRFAIKADQRTLKDIAGQR